MKHYNLLILSLIFFGALSGCSTFISKQAEPEINGTYKVIKFGDDYKVSYYRFMKDKKIRILHNTNNSHEEALSLLMADTYPKEHRYILGKKSATFFFSDEKIKGHGRVDLDESGFIKDSIFYPDDSPLLPIMSKSKQVNKYAIYDDNLNKIYEKNLISFTELETGIFLCQTPTGFFLINKNGHKISKGTYDWISGKISNGLIAYKKGDKFGYLNTNGAEAIPAIYDLARTFHKHWAAVKLGEHWKVLSTNGKVIKEGGITKIGKLDLGTVVPYQDTPGIWKFWSIHSGELKGIRSTRYSPLHNTDLFQITLSKGSLLVDQKGNIPLKVYYKYIRAITPNTFLITLNSDRTLVIDINGKPLSKDITLGIDNISNDIMITKKGNSGSGLMDLKGNTILQPEYSMITNLQGMHSLRKRIKVNKKFINNVWIFKDREIKNRIYNSVGFNRGGYMTASSINPVKYGILKSETLEWVIPPKYRYISTPVNGYFVFTDTNRKEGVIDEDQNILIPAKWKDIDISEDFAICKGDDSFSIINLKTGQSMLEGNYNHIRKNKFGWTLESDINI